MWDELPLEFGKWSNTGSKGKKKGSNGNGQAKESRKKKKWNVMVGHGSIRWVP